MRLNRYLAASTLALLLGAALWAGRADRDPAATVPDGGSVAGRAAGLPSRMAGAAAPAADADPLRQLAARLPADFQADVLLRLAATADPPEAPDLILQAYRLAPRAALPLPGRVARGSAGGDDDLLSPRTAGLDQLSLQIRAVRAMLAVAPERIGLLSSPFPGPRAAGCEADYVDDPSAVYELASTTLPATAAARTAFALQVIGRAKTEMDLLPAMKFVTALPPLAPADELAVADGLGALFARAQGNDAGFAATGLALASGMDELLARYDGAPGARRALEGAFHNYLATHLAAARCPASLGGEYRRLERSLAAGDDGEAPGAPGGGPPPALPPHPFAGVGEAIRHAGSMTLERLHADRGDGLPSDPPAADSLLATLNSAPVLAAAAADTSGRTQRIALREVLRYLEYAPPGPERDGAFAQLEAWLASGGVTRDHDRWFGDLRALAGTVRRWPDGEQRLRQLAASRDAVVGVYARLMLNRQFP